jgi:hypothetical protein
MKTALCPHCGFEIVKVAKERSTPQMRRTFGVFAAALNAWPESHRFQPAGNMRWLRSWLEVQAGHYEVVMNLRAESVSPERLEAALGAVLNACDTDRDRFFIEVTDDLVTVKKVNSIAYDKLSHKEACALFDEISNVLFAEIGIDAETLLREYSKAA